MPVRSKAPKISINQRLVLAHAVDGQVIVPDPYVPLTVYRSLCWPHGFLRQTKEGFVITHAGREAIRVRARPIRCMDDMEAAE